MNYQNRGNDTLVDQGILDSIDQIDGIIFDCDGVLVDVSKSYDLAIKQSTEYILKNLVSLESIPISSDIINGFKDTGGFNDEVDITYALILSLTTAAKLGADQAKFISEVIKNADDSGIESIEKFLRSKNADLTEIRKMLDYPSSRLTSPLSQIFNQIFYGSELYEKIFNKKSQLSQIGLIKNDLVIVTVDLLSMLKEKFGSKIAIVTGRGKESISYSLKELMNEFNIESSVFLEDEARELAKPNPKSLIMSIEKLGTKHCLFVGDSMEDLIMANKATEMGSKTTFCGIYGTNKNPLLKREFFEKNQAPIILGSIHLLPKVLNLAD